MKTKREQSQPPPQNLGVSVYTVETMPTQREGLNALRLIDLAILNSQHINGQAK